MGNDLRTLENQQDLVEMLTRRSESFLTAYNEANIRVGELMRDQLTRDQLLADCVAPLKLLHYLTTGGQLEAAPPLTEAHCLELMVRIEGLRKPVRASDI